MDSQRFDLPLSLELVIARTSVDAQLRAALLANPLQLLREQQVDVSAFPELSFHDGLEMGIEVIGDVVHITLPALSTPSVELNRDYASSRDLVVSGTNGTSTATNTVQTAETFTTEVQTAETTTTTVAEAEVGAAEAVAVGTTEAEAAETTSTVALEAEAVLVVVAI